MDRVDDITRNAAKLAQMQTDALYALAINAIMNLVSAGVCVFIYWSAQTAGILMLWLGALTVQSSIWGILSFIRQRQLWPDVSSRAWRSIFVAIMAVGGVLWGLGGLWMLPLGTPDQALVVSLMVMGSVVCTFPVIVYPPAHIAFQVPAFTLSAFGFIASANPYGYLIAGMSLLLAVALAHIGIRLGAVMISSMRLAIENADLAQLQQEQASALARANDDLQRLSYLDPLTGLANRRRLMIELRGFGRAAGALIMILDVDHFKRYNDAYGHSAGDECLRQVANVLTRFADSHGGVAARQGGEEFCILLAPDMAPFADVIAENVRRDIEALYDQHRGALERAVTVSIGYAIRGRDMADDDLMHLADTAVYRAKNAGRNRVCGPPPEGAFEDHATALAAAG